MVYHLTGRAKGQVSPRSETKAEVGRGNHFRATVSRVSETESSGPLASDARMIRARPAAGPQAGPAGTVGTAAGRCSVSDSDGTVTSIDRDRGGGQT